MAMNKIENQNTLESVVMWLVKYVWIILFKDSMKLDFVNVLILIVMYKLILF